MYVALCFSKQLNYGVTFRYYCWKRCIYERKHTHQHWRMNYSRFWGDSRCTQQFLTIQPVYMEQHTRYGMWFCDGSHANPLQTYSDFWLISRCRTKKRTQIGDWYVHIVTATLQCERSSILCLQHWCLVLKRSQNGWKMLKCRPYHPYHICPYWIYCFRSLILKLGLAFLIFFYNWELNQKLNFTFTITHARRSARPTSGQTFYIKIC